VSDTNPLSGDEVAALMSELNEAAEEAAPIADGEVRSFALGRETMRPAARLAALERMGERMAGRLRLVIEPFSRARCMVTAEPLQTLRFDDLRAELPPFTSISLYRLRPLKAGTMVILEPAFIASMVDTFYGGTGQATKHRRQEFTPAEDRLLGRIADAVVEALVQTWADITPIVSALAARETNADYATMVRGDEGVVVQRFAVTPGQGAASMITIVYPLAALRPFEAQLSAKVHADAGPVDHDWRMRLEMALEGVRLPVRSVLARPELTVSQLLALKPGDVIPINLAPKVPLIVANKRLAWGTIGEQEGRAALMIEQIERG
jgi:flagellar motor switch protein FliM